MIVSNVIDLKANELSEREWRKLFAKLTFYDADRNEVFTYKRLSNGRVRIPRGAWSLLPGHVEYEDRRIEPERRSLTFAGELDYSDPDKAFEGQRDALNAIMTQEQGLVIAQPGWGKTNVLLAFACEVKTPTLVLVHTQDIFEQWTEYAAKLIPGVKLGSLQGENWTHGDIDIAMVQTVRDQMPRFRRKWAEKYGAVLVDEAHHSPAETWELILNAIPAKYRIGATATKTRADGMHPYMKSLIGPIIFEQKFESKVPVKVIPLKSGFKFSYRGRYDWGELQRKLIADKKRNRLIAETTLRQIQKGHSCLILSRRIEHLENLYAVFEELDEARLPQVKILTGKMQRGKRHPTIQGLRDGKIRCLLATQLADEALDVPRLSRVFLTYPGKAEGRIIQQIGRGLREHTDKNDAIIFDVVDDEVSVLRRQWMERKGHYKKLKIKIMKTKDKEVRYGTKARERREVAHRIRQRLERGRRSRRGS